MVPRSLGSVSPMILTSAFPVRGIRPLFLPRRTGILILLHFCSSRSSLVRTTKPLVNATVVVAVDKTLKCDQLEYVWGRLLANIHCAKTCASIRPGPNCLTDDLATISPVRCHVRPKFDLTPGSLSTTALAPVKAARKVSNNISKNISLVCAIR